MFASMQCVFVRHLCKMRLRICTCVCIDASDACVFHVSTACCVVLLLCCIVRCQCMRMKMRKLSMCLLLQIHVYLQYVSVCAMRSAQHSASPFHLLDWSFALRSVSQCFPFLAKRWPAFQETSLLKPRISERSVPLLSTRRSSASHPLRTPRMLRAPPPRALHPPLPLLRMASTPLKLRSAVTNNPLSSDVRRLSCSARLRASGAPVLSQPVLLQRAPPLRQPLSPLLLLHSLLPPCPCPLPLLPPLLLPSPLLQRCMPRRHPSLLPSHRRRTRPCTARVAAVRAVSRSNSASTRRPLATTREYAVV